MNTPSTPSTRRTGRGLRARAALAVLVAATIAAPLAHAKCAAYINADGSLRAYRYGADCYAGSSSVRVAPGVYRVSVGYPLDWEIDEESGVYTYSFTQGICNASLSDGATHASSISIHSSIKPSQYSDTVGPDYDANIVYTVRTFAATQGPTLVPADQDFTLMCVDWTPYEPMRLRQAQPRTDRPRAAR
ncbi:hypothetical protein GLE_0477 [Lysobacter enzymogenes]|uniref:Uncharacterized protein n=1 Tax=Lysobacter enzymogenes TaxID=69 RepID=A0A0S2DBC0_LYSEN|nr:hypothetical protein [Lysobacter enzymogenes]ALN55835.1 hypothetical protein GLE_0477 [Lysobacter enzymogenes]QCW24816.1 hypothetical protein FE772_03135 [Lysobacter enzymogenes]